jgi:hypothetical protein
MLVRPALIRFEIRAARRASGQVKLAAVHTLAEMATTTECRQSDSKPLINQTEQ